MSLLDYILLSNVSRIYFHNHCNMPEKMNEPLMNSVPWPITTTDLRNAYWRFICWHIDAEPCLSVSVT